MLEKEFWKKKSLLEMNDEEWEAICDGCGNCCYRKFIDGRGTNEKLYYTRISCDLLDLKSGKCSCYSERFKKNPECIHLTKKNVDDFNWLPKTCAYRLLLEKKTLPDWHPLVCGSEKLMDERGVRIKDGIHESEAGDWEDYVTGEEFTRGM